MNIEGEISIALSLVKGQVEKVTIDSTRPVYASRLFQGKKVEEALKMIPMLYVVCGTAQTCAAVRATEQALGIKPGVAVDFFRESLVRLETIREHLWRILLDWPEVVHQVAEKNGMSAFLELQRDYKQFICGEHDPFMPGASDCSNQAQKCDEMTTQLGGMLQQQVFGLTAQRWLQIHDLKSLQNWLSSSPTLAAQLIQFVIKQGWSDLGQSAVKHLPVLDARQLQQVLQDDNFVLQPKWRHSCYETSAQTRVDSALLQQLKQLYGNGLLVRLVARLTEIAQLSLSLLPGIVARDETDSVDAATGLAQVEAARGRLIHRIALEGDQIRRYQILAPTEWNFHPQGVVAQSLKGLHGSRDQIGQQAKMLINAIDPCVGYDLRLE